MASLPERDDHRSGDLALVRRILRGDVRELGRLSERLRCIARVLRVLNLKHGCVLSDDELADLAQDVLLIAWKKLPEYGGAVALEGWLYGICVLELMNHLRRKRRRSATAVGDEALNSAESSEEPSPLDYEDLHRCLERLAPEEERVIRLKHFEERTFEEIGRLLGLSPNTVKARYYRGLMELRPLLTRGGNRP